MDSALAHALALGVIRRYATVLVATALALANLATPNQQEPLNTDHLVDDALVVGEAEGESIQTIIPTPDQPAATADAAEPVAPAEGARSHASVRVTVEIPDAAAPTVSISSGGDRRGGTWSLVARATDNDEVRAVTFFLDGEAVPAVQDASWWVAEIPLAWRTRGGGLLTALAIDAWGNSTVSAAHRVEIG